MKSAFDAYGTDAASVDDGVWHEFYVDGDLAAKLKLRPENAAINSAWRRARLTLALNLRKWADENNHDLDGGKPIPDDVDLALMAEVYYKAVCTDWAIIDRAGKKMKFTEANFIETMQALPLLFDEARKRAKVLATYRIKAENDAVKG